MRALYVLGLALLVLPACDGDDPDPDPNARYDRRLFPRDPHFVVSVLDVNDTPELVDTQYVFVGKVIDTQDPNFDLRIEAADTLAWMYYRVRAPWMFSTVTLGPQLLRARLKYDNAATVTLTGTFGGARQTIPLRPLGYGFYYFRSHEHPLAYDADYTLDVRTADGVRLRAATRTPGRFVWPLKPRYDVRVRKWVENGKTVGEIDDEVVYLDDPSTNGVENAIEVGGLSLELALNRCLDLVPEGKGLRHEHLGDYLRSTIYGVAQTSPRPADARGQVIYHFNARCGRRDSIQVYLRRSHMSRETYTFYHEESMDVGVGTPLLTQKGEARGNATVTRDGSHYVRVSNVHRVSDDGTLLPVAQSDAIGGFGAMSSQYRRTVYYPIRSYDACTVYPGTRCADGSTSPAQ